jgi:hypothetical protein
MSTFFAGLLLRCVRLRRRRRLGVGSGLRFNTAFAFGAALLKVCFRRSFLIAGCIARRFFFGGARGLLRLGAFL